jgi:hypothetical protein
VNKINLSKYFIFVSVLSLITIFVFMVSKSYDNLMGPVKQAKENNLIRPINTKLDLSTVDLIKSRLDIKYDSTASEVATAPIPTSQPKK